MFYASRFYHYGACWNYGSAAGMFKHHLAPDSAYHENLAGSYYSDTSYLSALRFLYLGGHWNFGSDSGMFSWVVAHDSSATYSYHHVGSATTYYSDCSFLYASGFVLFGGAWAKGDYHEGESRAGVFLWSSFNTPYVTMGSATTYYSDDSMFYASRCLLFGEDWNDGSIAGVFLLYVNYGASNAHSYVGSFPTPLRNHILQ